jgi:hypothetical protein
MGVNGMGRFHQGTGWERHGLGAAEHAPLKVEKADDFGAGGVLQGKQASKAGALPGDFPPLHACGEMLVSQPVAEAPHAPELCGGPAILEDDARQPHLPRSCQAMFRRALPGWR